MIFSWHLAKIFFFFCMLDTDMKIIYTLGNIIFQQRGFSLFYWTDRLKASHLEDWVVVLLVCTTFSTQNSGISNWEPGVYTRVLSSAGSWIWSLLCNVARLSKTLLFSESFCLTLGFIQFQESTCISGEIGCMAGSVFLSFSPGT